MVANECGWRFEYKSTGGASESVLSSKGRDTTVIRCSSSSMKAAVSKFADAPTVCSVHDHRRRERQDTAARQWLLYCPRLTKLSSSKFIAVALTLSLARCSFGHLRSVSSRTFFSLDPHGPGPWSGQVRYITRPKSRTMSRNCEPFQPRPRRPPSFSNHEFF